MSDRLDFSYNNVDIELEPGLALREFGFENFERRTSNHFYHKKLHHTFQFIEYGKGAYFLNGKKYDVNGGCMFYLPPDTPVMYYESSSNPYKYWWFALSGERAETVVKNANISIRNPVIRFPEHNRIIGEIESALAGIKNQYAVKGHIYIAISLISVAGADSIPPPSGDRLFREITDFIHCNYPQPEMQIQQILDIFHISQPALYRLFMEKIGISPKHYLLGYRMKKAKELLEKNNSVSKAAESVGYSNVYHFSKQFKAFFHATPSEFRPHI